MLIDYFKHNLHNQTVHGLRGSTTSISVLRERERETSNLDLNTTRKKRQKHHNNKSTNKTLENIEPLKIFTTINTTNTLHYINR